MPLPANLMKPAAHGDIDHVADSSQERAAGQFWDESGVLVMVRSVRDISSSPADTACAG